MKPTRRWSPSPLALLAALAVLMLAGPARASQPGAAVRVLAPSSLADALTALSQTAGDTLDLPNPQLSFSGSNRVARQLTAGAPADLVVTADASWMQLLLARRLIEPRSVFVLARNRLVLAVRPGSPPLRSPEGLASDAVATVAIAAEHVPAGQRAREALAFFGLHDRIRGKLVTGRNARATLALLDRAEVDAALVYRTDAWASPRGLRPLTLPAASHQPIVYAVGLTPAGQASASARSFASFLTTPAAHRVLEDHGFEWADPRWAPRDRPARPPTTVGRAEPSTARASVTQPLWLTLRVAALSLLLSSVPAVLLGWLLARRDFFGKAAVSTVLMTPLVLPPVVIGFALLKLVGRTGPLAGMLRALGIQIAFTHWGAVLAAAVVGFPLLTLMSRLAIESVDPRYEDMAETLGRSRIQAFFQVGLPMAAPGLLAGCVLAYARALGEFGATAVLATDIPGQTRTLALAIFALYEQPGLESEARSLVWLSIGLSAGALVGYERLTAWQKRRLAG